MDQKNWIIVTLAIALVAVSIGSVISLAYQYDSEPAKLFFDHPCQMVILENHFLNKNDATLQDKPGVLQEELDASLKNIKIRGQEITEKYIENDCSNTQSQWLSSEFDATMKALLTQGF